MFSFLFSATDLGCGPRLPTSAANLAHECPARVEVQLSRRRRVRLAGRAGASILPRGVVAQFSGVWETVNMAKRSLRILKRVGGTASLGVCEACSAQFSADPRQLGQSGVQQQFNAHKCDIAQKVAPVAKEAAKVSGK